MESSADDESEEDDAHRREVEKTPKPSADDESEPVSPVSEEARSAPMDLKLDPAAGAAGKEEEEDEEEGPEETGSKTPGVGEGGGFSEVAL